MTIDKVLVVGMGLMGSGSAKVCVQSGFDTYAFDVSKEASGKGLGMIEKTLEKRVVKGKLSGEQKSSIMGRLKMDDDFQKGEDTP